MKRFRKFCVCVQRVSIESNAFSFHGFYVYDDLKRCLIGRLQLEIAVG